MLQTRPFHVSRLLALAAIVWLGSAYPNPALAVGEPIPPKITPCDVVLNCDTCRECCDYRLNQAYEQCAEASDPLPPGFQQATELVCEFHATWSNRVCETNCITDFTDCQVSD